MVHQTQDPTLDAHLFVGKRPVVATRSKARKRNGVEAVPVWLHFTVAGTGLDAEDTRSLCKLTGHDVAELADYAQHCAVVRACSAPQSGALKRLNTLLGNKGRQN